jgi:hypothetical protein
MKLNSYLHLALSLTMCGAISLVDRGNFIFNFRLHNIALVEVNSAVCLREIV